MSDYFGPYFDLLRQSVEFGGSELELGLSLFSLAVSVKARRILEIGRYRGFSTLALAGALRFIDEGWHISPGHMERPDVDYADLLKPHARKLFSVDVAPRPAAAELIQTAGLTPYVEYIDRASQAVAFNFKFDLIFIDGDHTYEGCKGDVMHFVPDNLPVGGYFVLHDYFGWYAGQPQNNSPIKRVADELVAAGAVEHLLVDTRFMSFVIFRKVSDAFLFSA